MKTEFDCNNSIIDAYSPKEMACKAETIGVTKANLGFLSSFMLAVLAGAFIAFAACFFTTCITGIPTKLLGPARLVGAIPFSLGLILVVVAGAELFTGNTLIVIATITGKVRWTRLLWNWAVIYVGNFVGSLLIVVLVYYAWQWKMGDMAVGITAYNIAAKKISIPFLPAFYSGILCNTLVCLAVWLCYSARSTTDKILSIILPITAFVVLGFEHSIANMYFIPIGMMLSQTKEFMAATSGLLVADPSIFTVYAFLVNNLVPVTLGNIVGGSVFVGVTYWIIYLRGDGKGPVTNGLINIEKETEIDYATGAALFVKKEIYEKVGLFDEKYYHYYEDVDLII